MDKQPDRYSSAPAASSLELGPTSPKPHHKEDGVERTGVEKRKMTMSGGSYPILRGRNPAAVMVRRKDIGRQSEQWLPREQ